MGDSGHQLDRLEEEYDRIGKLQERIETTEAIRRAVPLSVFIFGALGAALFPGAILPPEIGSGYFLQWAVIPVGLVAAAVAAEVWGRIRLPELQNELARMQLEFDETRFLKG